MTQTRAQLRASERYHAKLDTIVIRPDKARGATIRSAAAAAGESVQGYILTATCQRMDHDAGDMVTVRVPRQQLAQLAGDKDPAQYLQDALRRALSK